ncbi:MAG: GtrA family protein [Candidatus Methylomirabilales bacterium]
MNDGRQRERPGGGAESSDPGPAGAWGRLARFVGFGTIGVTGLGVNQLALWLATESLGLHYLLSAALATAASTSWNFLLVEKLVFAGGREGRPRRFIQFALLNTAWLALRIPLLYLLTEALGMHYLLSNLLLLGASSLVRFGLSDFWIWAPKELHLYDLHGIVGISSEAPLPELANFRVGSLAGRPHLEVLVRWQGFGGLASRVRVEAAEHRVSYVEHIGGAGFALTADLSGPLIARVPPLLRLSPHVLYTNVVEPMLRWLLVERGYALAHAACLEIDGSGLLLTSRTDTGKTSTCLKVVASAGARFLSDDMTILSPDGRAFSYPKPLTISAHTLSALSAIWGGASLPLWRRVWLVFQGRLHSRSGRRVGMWLARRNLPVATLNALVQLFVPPPKFSLERLIPGAELLTSVMVTRMVAIERGKESVEELSLDEACRILLENTDDAFRFPPYPRLASALMDGKGEVEAGLLRQVLKGVGCVRLTTPDHSWDRHLSGLAARAKAERALAESEANK